MEWIQFLRQLLLEAEAEHMRLGLPFEGWADWYAEYISPRILSNAPSLLPVKDWAKWYAPKSDTPADGITEGD